MAAIVAINAATEVDSTHPSGINQANRPVLDMMGQGSEVLGSTGSPHFV